MCPVFFWTSNCRNIFVAKDALLVHLVPCHFLRDKIIPNLIIFFPIPCLSFPYNRGAPTWEGLQVLQQEKKPQTYEYHGAKCQEDPALGIRASPGDGGRGTVGS